MSRRGLLEAILFICGESVPAAKIASWMQLTEEEVLALAAEKSSSGLVIRRMEEHLQLATDPCYAAELRRIFASGSEEKLSNPLLETLAIVAYRQPVTRQEVDDIRGVHSGYALSALADRGLVRRIGTKDVLGRPPLYGTTEAFLRQFDRTALGDLPPLPEADRRNEAPPAPEEDT